jgi:hypothetical protein
MSENKEFLNTDETKSYSEEASRMTQEEVQSLVDGIPNLIDYIAEVESELSNRNLREKDRLKLEKELQELKDEIVARKEIAKLKGIEVE